MGKKGKHKAINEYYDLWRRKLIVSTTYKIGRVGKMKRKMIFIYVWVVMTCAILRSGDIETNPGPFGGSSDDEE